MKGYTAKFGEPLLCAESTGTIGYEHYRSLPDCSVAIHML